MMELVQKLTSKISSDEEVQVLQQLHSSLGIHEQTDEEFFLPGLSDSNTSFELSDGNPYPSASLEGICPTQNGLNKFMCYVFERRFGWSETDTEDGRRVRRLSSTGATLSAGTGKQKTVINSVLDNLLKWFLHQEMNISLLAALKYVIKQTVNLPVVRNRAVIHTFDWCKANQEHLCDETYFQDIQALVVLSLTDVWSAIRNAAASRLAPVTVSLNLHHLKQLFESLVKICEEDSSWQMKEGAIMGINGVVQRFMNRHSSKSPMSSPRVLDTELEEKRVPDFISEKIHAVVFSLLSHSQLTIREHAAKTLATYITCSTIADALSTLNEVIQILRSASRNTEVPVGLVTLLQTNSGQFLDDYAAEGFLGVCIFLVKVIPLSCLLPNWPEYISTFLLYLSHPASTVRQAASSVFKYLVVKSSHSVVILKLLLQALAMGWNPDTESMTLETDPQSTDVGQPSPSVCDYTGSNLSDTWEGREGRMFAYELIFRYLIKNHWLYTFGPAGSGMHIEPGTSKEPEKDSMPNGEPAQLSSTPNSALHHVESEKSLAVRFLTQADLKAGGLEQNKKFTRLMSTDQDQGVLHQRAQLHSSHGAPHSQNSGVGSDQYEHSISLLRQAQMLDQGPPEGNLEHAGALEEEKQLLQLKRLRQLLENNNNKDSTACTCGWVEKEHLQDMSRILKVILYQTAESLGHSQWELRRIANQVLPCLAEVIRWFDVNILVSIWNSYLNVAVPTCLMTFTSVQLLKESVIHAVKLLPLLHRPPNTWQDHDQCSEYLAAITGTVQRRVAGYLPHLQYLVQRPSCDKLTVSSADVLLMAYEHFPIPTDQRFSHYQTVLEMWRRVFVSAHPQTRISPDILHSPRSHTFTSPLQGYLSCCLVKPDNMTQCAKQVEKTLISEIHHRIPVLMCNLSAVDRLSVLPILTHYVGQFVEDSHISRTLLESVHGNVEPLLQHLDSVSDQKSLVYCHKCVLNTLREMAAVMALKSVELSLLQKLLLVYEKLCAPISLDQHMTVLVAGITARINECDFTPGSFKIVADRDLYLMSNDIPTLYSNPEKEDSDSEEDIHVVGSPGARFPESLTLNTSNNSGSLTGRLSSLSGRSLEGGERSGTPGGGANDSDDDQSESSDWDSWDEEEEGQSAFGDAFSEFLAKLQTANSKDFQYQVKKLSGKQKTVITSLLKSS